jgi:hypothetical protein
VNSSTIISFTGELSDFHYILTLLEELDTTDYCEMTATSSRRGRSIRTCAA